MDILSNLADGFSVATLPLNILLLIFGCFIGTLVGALPGLGPVNGVAILLPLTFALGLDATSSLILLSSVYYGCMYGGRVSAILLNIPGDEPAIMTTLDGYPMAQKGHEKDALAVSAVASFTGATLATIGLTLFAPLLAKAAMKTKIEVMSFDGVRRMVEVGLGVAILPFGALEDSNLAMVPINEPWALRDLVVVTKPGVELGEQHRQCSTVCLEETTL